MKKIDEKIWRRPPVVVVKRRRRLIALGRPVGTSAAGLVLSEGRHRSTLRLPVLARPVAVLAGDLGAVVASGAAVAT